MQETMLKIEHVSKRYRLGMIGGTTLREELQRLHAKMQNKEDPTRKIGAADYVAGETFMALDDVSFSVKKGERVGIIGHNGAGKSTLLKLISRITAPTDGDIWMNGRVASMLEVGTGFHGELTGRENIYMNGAILGMKKKEIDAKMEDIIEFSECRQFIDTPVKRYSSGMYVKLAFSVAAHLDSEIMIMDEVLAVGDMAFQKKCLEKMSNVSKTEGRTVLYVSHNMNTIKQLCERCIVLDHGKIIFDGDCESAIRIYMGVKNIEDLPVEYDLKPVKRLFHFGQKAKISSIRFLDKNSASYKIGEPIKVEIKFTSMTSIEKFCIFASVKDLDYQKIGMFVTEVTSIDKGNSKICISIPSDYFVANKYVFNFCLTALGSAGSYICYDDPGALIIVEMTDRYAHGFIWEDRYWGKVCFPELKITEQVYEGRNSDVSLCP